MPRQRARGASLATSALIQEVVRDTWGRPLDRTQCPGRALCAPRVPSQSRVRARCHPLAHTRHRRECRALPGGERAPAQGPSGRRPHPPGRNTAGRHGRRARQLPDLERGGDVPDLAGDRRQAAGLLRRLRLGQRHVRAVHRRRDAHRPWSLGRRRHVFDPGTAADRGPAAERRRRSARVHPARGPEPRVLAARIRRQSLRRRPVADAQCPPGRNHRRRTRRLLRHRGRQIVRCRRSRLRRPRVQRRRQGPDQVGHELVAVRLRPAEAGLDAARRPAPTWRRSRPTCSGRRCRRPIRR